MIKSLWHGMELGKNIPVTTCSFFFLEFMFVFSSAFLLVLLSSTRKKQKEQNRSIWKTNAAGKKKSNSECLKFKFFPEETVMCC